LAKHELGSAGRPIAHDTSRHASQKTSATQVSRHGDNASNVFLTMGE
jgi:hypothetical protein